VPDEAGLAARIEKLEATVAALQVEVERLGSSAR
jgi:hypothetical protein